jgi:hypothetical protein
MPHTIENGTAQRFRCDWCNESEEVLTLEPAAGRFTSVLTTLVAPQLPAGWERRGRASHGVCPRCLASASPVYGPRTAANNAR